jgi:hypothetical protein
MSTPPDDAQRTMEQKALRNVRALVDKIENTEELDRKSVRKHLTVIVAVVLVVFGIAFVAWRIAAPRDEARAVVIPPPANAVKK